MINEVIEGTQIPLDFIISGFESLRPIRDSLKQRQMEALETGDKAPDHPVSSRHRLSGDPSAGKNTSLLRSSGANSRLLKEIQ